MNVCENIRKTKQTCGTPKYIGICVLNSVDTFPGKTYERRKKIGTSWKDEIQNRLTTRFLAKIERKKTFVVKRF